MKLSSSLLSFSLFVGLLANATPLAARDAIHGMADLVKIEQQVKQVSQQVLPTTVALLSEQTGSSGSGVVTTADGLILTAAHVVQGVEEVTVVFPNGQQVPGKVLGANYSKDIAMVKISQPGPWPFAPMGASKRLGAGDWVIALGHSAGFDAARTPPVRFGRVISKGPGNFLTTDCTLIGGDSGGPLFDLEGNIIGINSSIGVSLVNNNHAGIDGFRQDWKRLLAGEAWGQLQMNAWANTDMAMLGIGPTYDDQNAAVVGYLTPRSPAAAAGIRIGDELEVLDGKPIRNFDELKVMLAKREAGDQIKLQVRRDTEVAEFKITLARRGDLERLPASGPVLRNSNSATDEEVPLRQPEERREVDQQASEFNVAIKPACTSAAQSTVRIWAGKNRLAYGTVVMDGRKVITKWSELAKTRGNLRIESDGKEPRAAKIAGVYPAEDIAVLDLIGAPLVPVQWSQETPALGSFISACQPDGRAAAYGVVSVLERNLRDTDLSFLGVTSLEGFAGPGVKVDKIAPDSGADAAGLKTGDVILKVGDRAISGISELKNAMTKVAPGSQVSLLVEAGGVTKRVEAKLGNRPKISQFTGQRLQQMERMGGPISEVRSSFSHALQSDMRLNPNQIGGPVVNLKGEVSGITIARADRTRSFVMPAAAVVELLKTSPTDPARVEVAANTEEPQMQQEENAPRGRMIPGGEARMRRHLSDMQRLMEHLQEEMSELEDR
jgi:serine protease Do